MLRDRRQRDPSKNSPGRIMVRSLNMMVSPGTSVASTLNEEKSDTSTTEPVYRRKVGNLSSAEGRCSRNIVTILCQ